MSLEYTIYLKRTDTLTKKAIEEYAASIPETCLMRKLLCCERISV